MLYRAGTERQGIAGMPGFNDIPGLLPINRYFIKQGIAYLQQPVTGLGRNLDTQPEGAVTEPEVQYRIGLVGLPALLWQAAHSVDTQ